MMALISQVVLVLVMVVLLRKVDAIAIDNGVIGQPTILCGADAITVSVSVEKAFLGRVFVKGFSEQPQCSLAGGGQNEESFTVGFDRCGVRRTRQVNPAGLSISATVIVSFHKIFLTKVDRAYRVSCFYMESTKLVTQNIDVSMLTTLPVNSNVPMPVCRYEILAGGQNGAPVQFARVGEPVFHKWSCASQTAELYCMRVHTCTVDDGQGGPPIGVLDDAGCSVDKFVLPNLEYITDLMAGQEAHVFKFADRPTLFFNCQVEIRIRDLTLGCPRPSCGSPQIDPLPTTVNPYGPQPPVVNPVVDPNYNRGGGRSGYPTAARLVDPHGDGGGAYRSMASARRLDGEEQREREQLANHRFPPATAPWRGKRRAPTTTGRTAAASHDDDPSFVADFDLPTRQLLVFDMESTSETAGALILPNSDQATHQLGGGGAIDVSVRHDAAGPPRGAVCMSEERFYVSAAAVAGLFVTSALLIVFALVNNKSLLMPSASERLASKMMHHTTAGH